MTPARLRRRGSRAPELHPARGVLPALALAGLLAGCQSAPPSSAPLPPSSSVLGVEVHFPVPMGRDPTLARVYLVKGPIHAQQQALPELLPATLIKGSRAYLLDPDPGTYSLVAVVADYAPPRSPEPIAGVARPVLPGTDAGDAIVFPPAMIHRTRTTIAPGAVKAMGVLEVHAGDRVHADTLFLDAVQERLVEAIRPGATSASGFAARFGRTWTLDSERSSWRGGPAERAAFVRAALVDFASSPWADVLRGPDPVERDTARVAPAAAPAPRPVRAHAPAPDPVAPGTSSASEPRTVTPGTSSASESQTVAPGTSSASEPRTVTPGDAPAPAPSLAALPPEEGRETGPTRRARRRPPGVPESSSLSVVELGMRHDEVQALLGEPDDTRRRVTSRGWLPFYTGPDALRIDWIYEGEGRVVFTVDEGLVTVVEVHAGESP